MNVEQLAIEIFAVYAKQHSGYPIELGRKEASRWIAGVRDHLIGDVTAVMMPKCYAAAEDLVRG